MKTTFLDASKYKSILNSEGPVRTLQTLLDDVGSKETWDFINPFAKYPLVFTAGYLCRLTNVKFACADDLSSAGDDDVFQMSVEGFGLTQDAAVEDLLYNALNPKDKAIPLVSPHKTQVGLKIPGSDVFILK